jgi:hypothetical protein
VPEGLRVIEEERGEGDRAKGNRAKGDRPGLATASKDS